MRTIRFIVICGLLNLFLTQITGAQWVHVDVPAGEVQYLAARGSTMFAQTVSGFLYSNDFGQHWTQANVAFADSLYKSYSADSVNYLMGIALNELPMLPGNISNLNIANVEVSSLLTLLAGVSMLNPGTAFDSIVVSLDTGTTALKISELMSKYALYAAGLSGVNPLSGAFIQGVLFSVNGGAHWISIYEIASTISIRMLEKTDSYLFAATSEGVYRTANNGATWTKVNNGLGNTNTYALTSVNTMLFAGTDAGVYRSTDNGATWHSANTGISNVHIRALATSGTDVFAGTRGSGVFHSSNYGSQWNPVNEGLSSLNINALAVLQGNLYAGTNDGLWMRPLSEMVTSVFAVLSLNKTSIAFPSTKLSQWRDTTVVVSNTGTDTLKILSITNTKASFSTRPTVMTIPPGQTKTDTIRFKPNAVGQVRDTLYITNNSLVNPFKLPLVGIGTSSEAVQPVNEIPKVYALNQNYPNPFNPSTTIRYGLPSRSHVRLQIFNILGQDVAEVVNADQAEGWNQIVWNANVSAGLYFYRLEAVSVSDPNKRIVDVKKMILLK
jgi:hypothetical protein